MRPAMPKSRTLTTSSAPASVCSAGDEDVVGLEIAVHDPTAVGGSDGTDHRDKELQGAGRTADPGAEGGYPGSPLLGAPWRYRPVHQRPDRTRKEERSSRRWDGLMELAIRLALQSALTISGLSG